MFLSSPVTNRNRDFCLEGERIHEAYLIQAKHWLGVFDPYCLYEYSAVTGACTVELPHTVFSSYSHCNWNSYLLTALRRAPLRTITHVMLRTPTPTSLKTRARQTNPLPTRPGSFISRTDKQRVRLLQCTPCNECTSDRLHHSMDR